MTPVRVAPTVRKDDKGSRVTNQRKEELVSRRFSVDPKRYI